MNLRSELITRIPIAPSDEELSDSELAARREWRLRDLRVDLPALNGLRASSVALGTLVRDGWLLMTVHLEESPQLALGFGTARGTGRGTARGDEVDDLFLQEHQRVLEQVKRCRSELLSATSPYNVPDGDPQSREAQLRGRTKRGRVDGHVLVPALPTAEMVPVDSPPTFLPRGLKATISARVVRLEPGRAELRDVVFEDMERSEHAPHLSQARSMELRRFGMHKSVETGSRLQRAMDLNLRLPMRVTIVFDWVDSQPKLLELDSFIEDDEQSEAACADGEND